MGQDGASTQKLSQLHILIFRIMAITTSSSHHFGISAEFAVVKEQPALSF